MTTETAKVRPPIKSGWRGNINGFVEGSDSTEILVSHVSMTVDRNTAWALCNMLIDSEISKCGMDKDQVESMSNLGAAIGRMIDHPAANNGGRLILKL